MTVYFAEEAFQPDKLDMAIVGRADYWEHIARQGVEFFTGKEPFMNWVVSHYFDDGHRFAASACWDLAVMALMETAEEVEYGEDLG